MAEIKERPAREPDQSLQETSWFKPRDYLSLVGQLKIRRIVIQYEKSECQAIGKRSQDNNFDTSTKTVISLVAKTSNRNRHQRRRRSIVASKRRSCAPFIVARLPAQFRWLITICLLWIGLRNRCHQAQALQITKFCVPSFVPNNLPTLPELEVNNDGRQQQQQQQQHALPVALGSAYLATPILFECDYDYQPDEDTRLTVKWFKDKEAEPFYQWLPEFNVRNFADWFRPLVDESFVSDPHDPLKRFRSLLIRKLSMNLTGQYTCLVSSLANQDSRSGSLVVYQAPRSFTFEHRIFPAPANLVAAPVRGITNQHQPQSQRQHQRGWTGTDEFGQPFMRPPPASANSAGASPTQFKGLPNVGYPYQWAGGSTSAGPSTQQQHQAIKPPLVAGGAANNPQQPPAATIVRPPNNNSQNQSLAQATLIGEQADSSTTKIVYTHDGRPIRRKLRRRRQLEASDLELTNKQHQLQLAAQISSWQLRKKLGDLADSASSELTISQHQHQQQQFFQQQTAGANYAIQLHHFQCQATQVTPRPVMALLVKRGTDSIAQYLHESSLVAIRPYQVNQSDMFPGSQPAAPSFGCGQPIDGRRLSAPGNETSPVQPLLVTLYDITVSATVALNVSLPPASAQRQSNQFNQINEANGGGGGGGQLSQLQQQQPIGVNTILSYRRGQRMSFECHLELTGTEFETRKRIGISEEEVYQFAEAEEQRRRLRLQQLHEFQMRQRQQQQQHGLGGTTGSSSGLLLGLGSPIGSSASKATGSSGLAQRLLLVMTILLGVLFQTALTRR